VMRATSGKDQTSNFLHAHMSTDGTYGLIFNEYITLLGIEETTTIIGFQYLVNRGEEPLVIIAPNDDIWMGLYNKLIRRVQDLIIKTSNEKGVDPWLSKI